MCRKTRGGEIDCGQVKGKSKLLRWIKGEGKWADEWKEEWKEDGKFCKMEERSLVGLEKERSTL